MGQIEVYELMHRLRKSGDDSFYAVKEVQRKLKDEGHSNGLLYGVSGDLMRLELSGYLEAQFTGRFRDWLRLYRLKKKYIKI